MPTPDITVDKHLPDRVALRIFRLKYKDLRADTFRQFALDFI